MAGRAYWKGYLRLSLVSCPVKLYAAVSSTAGKISFNMLHKDTMNRVQMKYHDPELGEVDRADLVKGYQFEKDKYVVVTQEELDAVQIETSKTITIDGFVDETAIDPIYYDAPYFMGPDGPVAEETYATILEAMNRAGKIALARIVLNGRERMIAIAPQAHGFLLTTLRANREVRNAEAYLEPLKVKVADDMLAMAEQIIRSKEVAFDPDAFEDHYEEALLTLVRSKIAGGEPVITKAPERGNVINLMDALKRSIEAERRPPAPSVARKEDVQPAAAKKTASKKPATKAAEPAPAAAKPAPAKKPAARKKAAEG